jgi:hypothetical protein
MKKYEMVSVINAIITDSEVFTNVLYKLTNQLNCPAGVVKNTTNLGWKNPIPWNKIIGWKRIPYVAAVKKKILVTYTGETVVADTVYTLRIKQLTGADGTQKLETGRSYVAKTGNDDLVVATALYNAFLELSNNVDITVTHAPTAGNEYFYVEGDWTDGVNYCDFEITDPVGAAGIATITVDTALVQPEGTTAIVDYYTNSTSYSVGSKTYTAFEFKHYVEVPGGEYGHFFAKEVTSVIFVNEDVLVAFHAGFYPVVFGTAISGAITGATKADPCVIESDTHGLAVGDRVLFTLIAGTFGHSDVLNENIWKVTAIDTGATPDTFTVDADAHDMTFTDNDAGRFYKLNTATAIPYLG